MLDLELEVMRGWGSIPTRGNILSLDFFYLYTVKPLMPILEFSYSLWKTRLINHGCFLYYRPQRSWAKVMFLQASVILSTGGGVASVHAGMPAPPTRQTPPGPGRHTPWTRQTPPRPGRHPPREADASIRSMSGRYASYWNAFLFLDILSHALSSISCLFFFIFGLFFHN